MLELDSGPNEARSPPGTVTRGLKPGHYLLQHYSAIWYKGRIKRVICLYVKRHIEKNLQSQEWAGWPWCLWDPYYQVSESLCPEDLVITTYGADRFRLIVQMVRPGELDLLIWACWRVRTLWQQEHIEQFIADRKQRQDVTRYKTNHAPIPRTHPNDLFPAVPPTS